MQDKIHCTKGRDTNIFAQLVASVDHVECNEVKRHIALFGISSFYQLENPTVHYSNHSLCWQVKPTAG